MKRQNPPTALTALNVSSTPPSGKLIKRTEAARLLNMSVSTLRRYEDELKPIVGPNGVHLFDEVVLRSAAGTISRRRAVASMGPSAGDVAADVFALLDESVHPVRIVKQLRVHPDAVAGLQERWAQMLGGFVVSAEQALELGVIARSRQATNAVTAIADLRRRVDLLRQSKQGSAHCQYCRQATACVCEPCAVEWRGPVTSFVVRLEARTNDGRDEVRVVTEAAWCDTIDPSGTRMAKLRSEWFSRDAAGKSEIAEFVRAIEARDAAPRTRS